MALFKKDKKEKEEKKEVSAQTAAKDSSSAKSTKKREKERKGDSRSHEILIKPLVTEKATFLSAENKYVFEVSVSANKIEVAKAIEDIYGIRPTRVNIARVGGKKVTYGRLTGERKSWKKAIITLPKGESINVYEGV